MVKVAINGFGRIGRCVLRSYFEHKQDNIEFVAINDPMLNADHAAHLLKYDSVMGTMKGNIEARGNSVFVDGTEIKLYTERDPEQLPWKQLGVDIVVESTGIFRDNDSAGKHIKAGAKKVII